MLASVLYRARSCAPQKTSPEMRVLRNFSNPSDCEGLRCMVVSMVFAGMGLGTAMASAANPLKITLDDARMSIHSGDHPVLAYRYGDVVFKSYVERLHSPLGINILRDQAEGHPHHHGLMFAVNVDGVEFWAEFAKLHPGRQVHRSFVRTRVSSGGGVFRAGITQRIDWVQPGDQSRCCKSAGPSRSIRPMISKLHC